MREIFIEVRKLIAVKFIFWGLNTLPECNFKRQFGKFIIENIEEL